MRAQIRLSPCLHHFSSLFFAIRTVVRFGGAWRIKLFASLGMLASVAAYADVEVCNTGSKYHITVARAFQEIGITKHQFYLNGWFNIAAGDCAIVAEGDAGGYSIWLRAEANGVVLADAALQGAGESSDQQFCVSRNAFERRGTGTGIESECANGFYLAAFPIVVTNSEFEDEEITIKIDPDDTVKNASSGQSAGGSATMPSLYGAVALAPDNRLTVSYLNSSVAEAKEEALKSCRKFSDAPCKIVDVFHDACATLLSAAKAGWTVAVGGADWSKEQTEAYGLAECRRAGDTCANPVSVCSTWPEKHRRRNEFEQNMETKTLEGMGKLLETIWSK